MWKRGSGEWRLAWSWYCFDGWCGCGEGVRAEGGGSEDRRELKVK